MEQIQFSPGSVPISVVAKVYGKDPNWVRKGIIEGWLPIGVATRDGEEITDFKKQTAKHRINYYVSPKLLYEHTGYVWRNNQNG